MCRRSSELGYPDMVTTTWHMLSGPAGSDKDIVEALNREVVKIVEQPDDAQSIRERRHRNQGDDAGGAYAIRAQRGREVGPAGAAAVKAE